mmetsp:Transcript_30321/g.70739  ORF Transcript_30321/g.70739 Transcript_30321/m.70739 type:complete len:218 (+) Transcript_30321:164-817(+)
MDRALQALAIALKYRPLSQRLVEHALTTCLVAIPSTQASSLTQQPLRHQAMSARLGEHARTSHTRIASLVAMLVSHSRSVKDKAAATMRLHFPMSSATRIASAHPAPQLRAQPRQQLPRGPSLHLAAHHPRRPPKKMTSGGTSTKLTAAAPRRRPRPRPPLITAAQKDLLWQCWTSRVFLSAVSRSSCASLLASLQQCPSMTMFASAWRPAEIMPVL